MARLKGALTHCAGKCYETAPHQQYIVQTPASPPQQAGPRQSQVMPRIARDLDGSRAVQRRAAAMLVCQWPVGTAQWRT